MLNWINHMPVHLVCWGGQTAQLSARNKSHKRCQLHILQSSSTQTLPQEAGWGVPALECRLDGNWGCSRPHSRVQVVRNMAGLSTLGGGHLDTLDTCLVGLPGKRQ